MIRPLPKRRSARAPHMRIIIHVYAHNMLHSDMRRGSGPGSAAMTEQQEGGGDQASEGQNAESSDGLSLVSVFGGHRLHLTVWKPTEPAR